MNQSDFLCTIMTQNDEPRCELSSSCSLVLNSFLQMKFTDITDSAIAPASAGLAITFGDGAHPKITRTPDDSY
jgi:hypothetical protein